MRATMWPLIASWLCPPLALLAYVWGCAEADRLVAEGRGFEMAFYHTPFLRDAAIAILFMGLCFSMAASCSRFGRSHGLFVGASVCVNFASLVAWLNYTRNWC